MIKKLFIAAGIGALISVAALTAAAALAGREIGTKGWAVSLVKDGDNVHMVKGDTGKTKTVSRTLAWTGGNTLKLDLAADVQYIQGPETSVVISGPQALIDSVRLDTSHLWRLNTEHETETISFAMGPNGIDATSDHENLKIVITAPSIDTFVLTGDGDLSLPNYNQPRLDADISGSGTLSATGETKALKVVVSGNGRADLGNVRAQDADVAISGSGDAVVRAVGKVKANISGSGNVELETKPESLESQISGTGSLDQN